MNINSQTVIAVARLAVALIVAIGTMLGFAVDADALLNAVLAVASVIAMAWVWWRNNNVTAAAQESQKVLDAIKGDAGDWKTIVIEKQPDEIAAGAVYPDDGKDEEEAVADEEYQTW